MRASGPAALLACLLAAAADAGAATPDAASFLGTWACEARGGGARFTWRVERRLAGPWLTGEGEEGGRVLSLDVWAVDREGRLGVRRQFSPDGFYLELDVVLVGDMALDLEGVLRRGPGDETRVREAVRFTGGDSFDAVWQAWRDGGWRTVVDETCRRADRAGGDGGG